VDYDPVVLTHAQALLTSSPEGVTDYIQADLRDTDTIFKGSARTLDLTRPLLHWPGPAPTRRSGRPWDLITRVRLNDHDKWFSPACRRYSMMAAHGWDEDQRGRWPGSLRKRVMLDIVSVA
jgi:hypothetical protein